MDSNLGKTEDVSGKKQKLMCAVEISVNCWVLAERYVLGEILFSDEGGC